MILSRKLTSIINKTTAITLPRYGRKLPIVVVNEYPKCGGTWLAKMLASAIDYPFIDGGLFVPSVPCVIRTHWHPHKSYSPGVCVIRDGRDVVVSLFHHRCKNIKNVPALQHQYNKRFGKPLSAECINEQLAGFLEIELCTARYGSQLSWAEHTRLSRRVCEQNQGISLVRYEELLAAPGQVLHNVVSNCFNTTLGADRVDAVVALHDIKTSRSTVREMSGNQTTFIRQGRAGSWKDVFGPEEAELVHRQFGTELMAGGFETDENWWKNL